MQGAGDQFLAGARLALDQDIGVGRRDLADLHEEFLHRRTGADDADLAVDLRGAAGGAFGGRLGAAAGGRGAAGFLAVLEDARHRLEHLVMVEGLGDVVHRAHLHRVDRRAQAGVAGHDQHRGALGQLDQFGTRCAGQAQVADDHVERGDAVALLRLLYRAGLADLVLVALEQTSQGGTDDGFVFDDEDMCHLFSSLDVLVTARPSGQDAAARSHECGYRARVRGQPGCLW
ncbi:hypothetical protein D3C76_1196260 [compost metagenome]